MTLYVKVTWPWAWPFLTLVLVTLERWSFFCFAGFWGRGCLININPYYNYQAWQKGHVQHHVTLTYKVTRDSCCVELYICRIPDPKKPAKQKKIVSLTSLEQEIRKVTLMFTWPWRTRSRVIVAVWIYIYLTSATPKTCETKKKFIALASRVPESGKVMLRVTWLWHTRSCFIVTVWIYIYLTSATPKTGETKKDHRSSVTSTRVRKGHAQGHVTLTYKVTLDRYSVDLYLFDIHDSKNLRNKKTIIALASLEQEIRKVALMVTVTLTYKVTRDSCCVELYIFDISDPNNLQNKKRSSLLRH